MVCPPTPVDLSNRSVLLVDPNAGDFGHLMKDDIFLAQCIAPLVKNLLVATSPITASIIRERFGIKTWETTPSVFDKRVQRPRLFKLVLSLPCHEYTDVIFQSFEELSTLIFMIRHPKKRIHLIATNNLRPDRLNRHPVLGKFILNLVFRFATTIIVHSEYERNKVLEISPNIPAGKLFIKAYHGVSATHKQTNKTVAKNTILYLGPISSHKPIEPLINFIKNDVDKKYNFLFCSIQKGMSDEARRYLHTCDNVEIRDGYLSDEDFLTIFSEAKYVVMTHDERFEGVLSGVFCDAIASGTPIIAQEMEPHLEYFLRYGRMGMLVNFSEDSWYKQLLLDDSTSNYKKFQKNMKTCKASGDLKSVRNVFKSVLSH